MNRCGLTAAEWGAYRRALRSSRSMRIKVRILDRNEDPVGSLTFPHSLVIDGVVDVDTSRMPSRELSLTLIDPRHRIDCDLWSPGRSKLFADNFIQVERGDFVEELDEWVDAPVFRGPLATFERTGPQVSITARGKEVLGLEPNVQWNPRTFRKGTRLTTVIEEVLRDIGERRFALPTGIKKTLDDHFSVGRWDEPWKVARRMAKNLNRQLFYDGEGYVRLRRMPDDPTWKFEDGNNAMLLEDPTETFDFTEFRNAIVVVGPEPEGKDGKKKEETVPRVKHIAVAERIHSLSPRKLGRNDEGRFAAEKIDRSHLKRKAEARDIAEDILRERLKVDHGISFSALPVPTLEENDIVSLQAERFRRRELRAKQFTIPLVPEAMQFGDPRKRPIRKHRARRKHRR